MQLMKAPPYDEALGMFFYASSSKLPRGLIRRKPEDFAVFEVIRPGIIVKDYSPTLEQLLTSGAGLFLWYLLKKRNIDQTRAIYIIAKRLNITPSKISYAGIKDTRAVTHQLISILLDNRRIERMRYMNISGPHGLLLELKLLGRNHVRISPSHGMGNQFIVVIRNVAMSGADVTQLICKIMQEVIPIGGIPAYFGYQRFGTIRPNTHLVGKNILKGDYEAAIMELIAREYPYESQHTKDVRREFREKRDPKGILRRFPRHLVYERQVLRALAKDPKDYERALRALPLTIRNLFIQAYQAYLFNKLLSRRLSIGLTFREVVDGDLVVNMHGEVMVVRDGEVNRIQKMMDEGKVKLCCRIIGYDYKLHNSYMGELEKELLEEEGINADLFRLHKGIFKPQRGSIRPAVMNVHRMNLRVLNDCHEPDAVAMSFYLEKGMYASIVLRELLKPKIPPLVGF